MRPIKVVEYSHLDCFISRPLRVRKGSGTCTTILKLTVNGNISEHIGPYIPGTNQLNFTIIYFIRVLSGTRIYILSTKGKQLQ